MPPDIWSGVGTGETNSLPTVVRLHQGVTEEQHFGYLEWARESPTVN